MWWLLPAIAVAAAWFFAILLGFVPPPNTKVLIKIRNAQLHVARGQLRVQPREFITDILQQAKIPNGFVAITHYNRVAFSRNIPNDIRQRLRNVLLNTP